MKKAEKNSSDFAVIVAGGKQYKVSQGSRIKIEKEADKKEGDAISFDKVLLSVESGKVTLGTPSVSGKKVSGKIAKIAKAAKVISARYKAKSNRLTRRGHRQPYMEVVID